MRAQVREQDVADTPVWRFSSSGRWFRLLALVLAVVLTATACSGNDGDDTESAGSSADAGSDESFETSGDEESEDSGDFEVEEEAMEDEEAMEEDFDAPAAGEPDADAPTEGSASDGEAGGDGSLGAGGTRVTPTAADLGRKLIFTAFVQVEVDDVAAASAEATTIVESMGGFLFGQNTVGGAQASSELIFKVLPDDFNRALEALGTVGELRNQSVSTDDVTERIVDLGSRIEVAELGVTRLREALSGSETLEDYAELERLLLDRESDLEVMRGQLRTLQDRVDLATITLTLTQDRVENQLLVDVSSYEGHNSGVSCPGQGSSVEAGSEVTVCFDVINNGDQTLTNIQIVDTVLEIGPDNQGDLLPVFGEIDLLPPGQSALVAFEIRPERDLRLRTTATAIPTDGVTNEQAGPSVSTQVNYEVRTFESDDPPGFGDGLSVGADILRGLWIALTVTLGFLLLPLLVLGPIVWLLWLLWRRVLKPRSDARRSARRPPPPGAFGGQTGGEVPPPPPPAAEPGEGVTVGGPES